MDLQSKMKIGVLMYLGINKNGQVGRITRNIGETAIIAETHAVDALRDVGLNPRSILQQSKEMRESEVLKRKRDSERKAKRRSQEAADFKEQSRRVKLMQAQQATAKHNPDEEKLRTYFAMQSKLTESEKTTRRMSADFNINDEVRDSGQKRPVVPRADFQIERLTGNPLTRNGAYGPVSDFDYIVKGRDVNDRTVLVSGTMYRRDRHFKAVPQMGFLQTLSPDATSPDAPSSGSWWGGVWNTFYDTAATQLENEAKKALEREIANAINPPQNPPTQHVVVHQPVQPGSVAVGNVAAQLGVPPMVVYAAGGMFAVGFLALMYKLVK